MKDVPWAFMEQIAKATARETVIKIVAALTMGTVWTVKTVLQDYAVILVKHTLLNRNKVFKFDRHYEKNLSTYCVEG